MKQVKYGHCDKCLTVYDGGTTFSMNSGKCINTVCKYINYLSPFVVCEDTSDPPPTYRCPYWYFYNSSSFNCTDECADGYLSFNRLCSTSCPESTPLIAGWDNITCVSSCPNNLYYVNDSIPQCMTVCEPNQ